MSDNNHDLNRAMTALKSDDSLLSCVLEMIDTIGDEQNKLKTGDDAEEAVVSVIQKTGTTLLQKWAYNKSQEAESLASADPTIRPHKKKESAGTHLLET